MGCFDLDGSHIQVFQFDVLHSLKSRLIDPTNCVVVRVVQAGFVLSTWESVAIIANWPCWVDGKVCFIGPASQVLATWRVGVCFDAASAYEVVGLRPAFCFSWVRVEASLLTLLFRMVMLSTTPAD